MEITPKSSLLSGLQGFLDPQRAGQGGGREAKLDALDRDTGVGRPKVQVSQNARGAVREADEEKARKNAFAREVPNPPDRSKPQRPGQVLNILV